MYLDKDLEKNINAILENENVAGGVVCYYRTEKGSGEVKQEECKAVCKGNNFFKCRAEGCEKAKKVISPVSEQKPCEHKWKSFGVRDMICEKCWCYEK